MIWGRESEGREIFDSISTGMFHNAPTDIYLNILQRIHTWTRSREIRNRRG
jgi:hypothetical protein